MNVLKNMEAIFLSTAIIAGATSFAAAEIPAPKAHVAQATLAANDKMVAVVEVKAKRLTAAQKAAL
jgi:hypothetical protein